MTQIQVTDRSETLHGVLIGDNINVWISQATKDYMENYEPVDQDSPDYEGTEDEPDITDPREQDLEGDEY